jgi:hypothetical protein
MPYKLPKEASEYVLFQRTSLIHDGRSKLTKKLARFGIGKTYEEVVRDQSKKTQHQIEKEYDVRDIPKREGEADDRRARGDRPGRGDIQPLPPDHDPPQLASVKVRERIDIAGVFEMGVDFGFRAGGVGVFRHGSIKSPHP